MRTEEIRRVYITLTKEEEEILNKASALVTNIHNNLNDGDELALINEDDVMHVLTAEELQDISWSLLNITGHRLEVIYM